MRHCKIDLTPGFIAFLCAYYFFDPAHTFWAFLISVALHEAAHLMLLSFLHVPIHRIRLSVCGAIIETPSLQYRQELAICAAGPCMNFILLYATTQTLPAFALVNLCLFAYNMLPLYPLDGGRMLRALLHLMLENRTAEIVEKLIAATCLTSIVAFSVYLTCVWHVGLWPVLVSALLLLRIAGTILPNRIFTLDKPKIP